MNIYDRKNILISRFQELSSIVFKRPNLESGKSNKQLA